MAQADDNQNVGVEIAIVEGGDWDGACRIFADQNNAACRILYESLG